MNNVLGFLEAKLMPLAAKTAQQRHLGAIRGAYVSFMPFIIVGSILLVISSFRIRPISSLCLRPLVRAGVRL